MTANDPGAGAPNPFEPPRADISPDAAGGDVLGDLTRDEIRAFVGERFHDFIARWMTASPSRSLFAGIVWPALVFNLIWLIYRKMFVEALLGFLLVYGASFLFASLGWNMSVWGLQLVVSAAVAALGSGLYLRRVRRAILVARHEEPDLGRRLALLRSRGGVSMLWPIIALMVRGVLQGVLGR